jgi:hypothetical protein
VMGSWPMPEFAIRSVENSGPSTRKMVIQLAGSNVQLLLRSVSTYAQNIDMAAVRNTDLPFSTLEVTGI